MSRIYRNKKEVPIPSGMHINHSDGRVYQMTKDLSGNNHRISIGIATSETTMHVNDNFKALFPDLWKEYYGNDELYHYNVRCGIYALSLGIGHTTGLYPILQDVFGPQHGNAIMDYCMYSIMSRLDVMQVYEEAMDEQVLFSDKLYSDAWYSDLFKNRISSDKIHEFRQQWVSRCHSRGITKAWISIDGSNNNCEVTDSDLPEQGKAKSHKNIRIVSYIYAVSALDGRPITWFINNGGMVDSKAFHEICSFLSDNCIEVEGVIIDRGFCTWDVLQLIREKGYRYILMLPSDTHGHSLMMEEYADKIRWKAEYSVSRKGIFGICDQKRLFQKHELESCINLYFDGANGSARSIALMDRIMSAAEDIQTAIDEGLKASVPQKLQKYLAIIEENGQKKIQYNYAAWQESMDNKGYYSIASSENPGPAVIFKIYHLRDASEKQYMILKSMEGTDVTRVHSTPSIESKFMAAFAAGVIRSELLIACKENDFDTNRMILEINRMKLQMRNDRHYYPVMNHSQRQKDILGAFGISSESFNAIAADVTHRIIAPINSQTRRMPEEIKPPEKKRGRPRKQPAAPVPMAATASAISKEDPPVKETPERKRGRPKGSLNKKTLERLAAEVDAPVKPKRGRGRPKGSLNKSTLEHLAKQSQQEAKPKRGRGRPKGSRNKTTLERLAKQANAETIPKRNPGRPKGSLNRKQ